MRVDDDVQRHRRGILKTKKNNQKDTKYNKKKITNVPVRYEYISESTSRGWPTRRDSDSVN